MFLSLGNFYIVSVFSLYIFMPSRVNICPINYTYVFFNSSLLLFNCILLCLQYMYTLFRFMSFSLSSFLYIIMSSVMHITLSIPLKIYDRRLWNIYDYVFSPKGNRNHLYRPSSVWNIVSFDDSVSNSTCQYPFFKSAFKKILEYFNSNKKSSSIGRG